MPRSTPNGRFLQQREERSVSTCNLEELHYRFFPWLKSLAHKMWRVAR